MSYIHTYIEDAARNIAALTSLSEKIEATSEAWMDALRADKKVIFCGNGGSAADSQHLAAELMGRFMIDRAPMPALALTVDTSALTAIGNDYGYENVFERQLRGIGQPGDVIVGLSTSGNSQNIINAFEVARANKIKTIGFTGNAGGKMAALSDILINVPHTATNHIQEAHITIGHLVCAIVESTLCSNKP